MSPRDACRSFQDVTLIIRENVEEHLAILPALKAIAEERRQTSANYNKNASSFSWKLTSFDTASHWQYSLRF
jgi:hypothetical protein